MLLSVNSSGNVCSRNSVDVISDSWTVWPQEQAYSSTNTSLIIHTHTVTLAMAEYKNKEESWYWTIQEHTLRIYDNMNSKHFSELLESTGLKLFDRNFTSCLISDVWWVFVVDHLLSWSSAGSVCATLFNAYCVVFRKSTFQFHVLARVKF